MGVGFISEIALTNIEYVEIMYRLDTLNQIDFCTIASKESIFQQQKEILLRTGGGPRLTCTEPEMTKSNWTTKEKKLNRNKKSLFESLEQAGGVSW